MKRSFSGEVRPIAPVALREPQLDMGSSWMEWLRWAHQHPGPAFWFTLIPLDVLKMIADLVGPCLSSHSVSALMPFWSQVRWHPFLAMEFGLIPEIRENAAHGRVTFKDLLVICSEYDFCAKALVEARVVDLVGTDCMGEHSAWVIDNALNCKNDFLSHIGNPPAHRQLAHALAFDTRVQRYVLDCALDTTKGVEFDNLVKMMHICPSFPISDDQVVLIASRLVSVCPATCDDAHVRFVLRALKNVPYDTGRILFGWIVSTLNNSEQYLTREDYIAAIREIIEMDNQWTWRLANEDDLFHKDASDDGLPTDVQQLAWDLLVAVSPNAKFDKIFTKCWVKALLMSCSPEHLASAKRVFTLALMDRHHLALSLYCSPDAFSSVLSRPNSLTSDQLCDLNCIRRMIREELVELVARHDDVK